MGMMKRFYEANKISITYYSNGKVKKATFVKQRRNGLYSQEWETQDHHGNVLEHYYAGARSIQGVEKKCNAICENCEVTNITIE